jgi:hypothetical protein
MSQRDYSRSVAITLVHGTWGRGFFPEWHLRPWTHSRRIRWFENESSFRRTLSDHLTNEKLSHSFHQFPWSGSNSVLSREDAARAFHFQIAITGIESVAEQRRGLRRAANAQIPRLAGGLIMAATLLGLRHQYPR